MRDVLVYTGEGVGTNLLRHVVAALTRWLGHRYDIKRVDARVLAEQPWTESTALLVMPGGRDVPYAKHLAGKANRRIRQYVENGGSYLGLCAGAYYACRRIEFELGTPMHIEATRELALFPGVGRGCVYPGFVYDSEVGARAVRIAIEGAHLVDLNQPTVLVYYNGGCTFESDQAHAPPEQLRTLAWYTEPPGENKPAIIECRVGKGLAVLSGVHIEYDASVGIAIDSPTVSKLDEDDMARMFLMRSVLRRLGLRTSDVANQNPPLTNMALLVRNLPPHDTIADAVWKRFIAASVPAADGTLGLITGDESFAICLVDPGLDVPVPIEEHHSLQPTATRTTVYIQRCQAIPSVSQQTSFDSEIYFRHREQVAQRRPWQFGHTLLYSEVITSTQTILERNPKLLQNVDDGTVCIAARQVSGRGRGQNSWVSSAGCLQFSLVLHHREGATVVFVQYLMALAVVEAVRSKPGYENVGLAIKWPNDIYSQERNEDDPGAPILRKIGGVLVNSTWFHGIFHLVVGCGVNLHNSEPTDCVNDAINRYNMHSHQSLDLIRKEEMLARIVTVFESFMATLNEHNSFAPLLPLYYKYWLHDGERVRLEAFGDIEAVIEGITEQGFLLTRSLVNMNDTYEHQPDGNSFDLMKHMIVRKK